MIKDAKIHESMASQDVTIDLHPSRPDYRGFNMAGQAVSMEADPTFAEIESVGGIVKQSSVAHTVLDDMFLISGEIPRVTPYETGLKNGIRYDKQTKIWSTDELITDERFLMCNLKGASLQYLSHS
jgi:7,8-dihydropterin-6-yl-methyl-4-(beta-D-ribofuranosyl)aminobenzene 5'-phosphate synthase